MALKRISKNGEISDENRESLFALGTHVDVASAPPRKRVFAEIRPLTLQEASDYVSRDKMSLDILDLPWDSSFAKELAPLALKAGHVAHATVFHAAAGDTARAREVWESAEPDDYLTPNLAAFATGNYAPHETYAARRLALRAVAKLIRFRKIANQLAKDRRAILEQLPNYVSGSPIGDGNTPNVFTLIWTPVIETLDVLNDDLNDKDAEKALAAAAKRAHGYPAPSDKTVLYDARFDALNVLFELAMHRGLGLAAHRIANKTRKSYVDQLRCRVSVLYAAAGDLAGAWELVAKMGPGGSPTKHDHLAQTLHELGLR